MSTPLEGKLLALFFKYIVGATLLVVILKPLFGNFACLTRQFWCMLGYKLPQQVGLGTLYGTPYLVCSTTYMFILRYGVYLCAIR